MVENFSTFEMDHAQRSENWYVDTSAVLGSQIAFDRSSTRVKVSKRRESIVEILQERFQEEQGCKGDKRIPNERMRYGRFEDIEGLHPE